MILPLTVKYHHVQEEIINQVARTSIDEVFINNHSRDIEGTFIFPLPEGASISEFAMFIGDQRVQGEILNAGQARRIYEDIVRRLRGQVKELVDEIKKLSLKHGTVTSYTSFLVTEKERMTLDAAAPAAQEALDARRVTGAGAVRLAKATAALKGEDRAALTVSEKIRYLEDKTFYLKDDLWVDSVCQETAAVKEIRFSSDEYFKLIAEKPGLAKYLSIGAKLIISYQGVNYKIVE